MRVTLADDLGAEVENAAARMGVKPATAARAALRKGLRGLKIEDCELEMNPRDRIRHGQQEKAKEALQWIRSSPTS